MRMRGRGQRKPWRRYVGIVEGELRKVRYGVELKEKFRALVGNRARGGRVIPRESVQSKVSRLARILGLVL